MLGTKGGSFARVADVKEFVNEERAECRGTSKEDFLPLEELSIPKDSPKDHYKLKFSLTSRNQMNSASASSRKRELSCVHTSSLSKVLATSPLLSRRLCNKVGREGAAKETRAISLG